MKKFLDTNTSSHLVKKQFNRTISCSVVFIVLLHGVFQHTSAQNLIPNGGFEENVEGVVTAWKQPTGMFYHYESRWVRRERYELESINGICLVHPDASEYLLVKFTQPLTKGERYELAFEYLIDLKKDQMDLSLVQQVELLFSDSSYDVSTRTKIYAQPDLIFDLSSNRADGRFRTLRKTYTARGGEQYLIVGRFFKPEHKEYLMWRNAYDRALKLTKFVYNNQLMTIPPNELIPNSALAGRRFNKRKKKLDKWYKNELDSLNNIYKPIFDTLEKPVSEEFDTRMYFDNFSLYGEHAFAAKGSEKPQSAAVKIGVTYRLNNVLFETNKSVLQPNSVEELDQIGVILTNNPTLQVHLVGHTDSVNTESYNLQLSKERAQSCADYLVSIGINPARIKADGKGESDPVAPNDSEEGRRMNRRVEFTFTEKQ